MSERKIYFASHSDTKSRLHASPKATRTEREVNPLPSHYKIGIAADPTSRVSSMSTGSPHEIRLVTVVDSDDAKYVERELHHHFRPFHYNGEWFEISRQTVAEFHDIDYITAQEVDWMNSSPEQRLQVSKRGWKTMLEEYRSNGDNR